MTSPAVYNFVWVRGSTSPLILQFQKDGVGMDFDRVELTIFKNDGKLLAFREDFEIVDADTGEVKFTPTPAQTRLLTESQPGEKGRNRYEVELRKGSDQFVYLLGTIAAIGGLNDDADEDSETSESESES